METESVRLSIEEFDALITIRRPESLNALNTDVLQGLLNALERIRGESALRVITIIGAGEKAFVAGADIATMNGLGTRAIADYVELGQRVMREVETLEIPVIAAVNGYALGGGLELALACDIILAADTAKLGQPEVNLGIIPGFGGTQRLIQRCGIGAARRLIYTGDMIDAAEAHRIGLVDQVLPKDGFKENVDQLVHKLIKRGPLAVRGAKKAIRYYGEQALLSGLRHEVETFLTLFQTADREEGMNAFLQKREASFTGR